MFRPSIPDRPARRHRGRPQPFGARVSAAAGRGAVVAVAGGLVLVGLVVVAALLVSPDPGSRPLGAESGSRGVGDGDRKGDRAPAGSSTPATTAPTGGPLPSPSARSPETPATQPSQTSQAPQPSASETAAPQAAKRHGKPPKDKPHPTPGHGSTHGPGKP